MPTDAHRCRAENRRLTPSDKLCRERRNAAPIPGNGARQTNHVPHILLDTHTKSICQSCGRGGYVDRTTGELKALEIQHSEERGAWLCKRCLFGPKTASEINPHADSFEQEGHRATTAFLETPARQPICDAGVALWPLRDQWAEATCQVLGIEKADGQPFPCILTNPSVRPHTATVNNTGAMVYSCQCGTFSARELYASHRYGDVRQVDVNVSRVELARWAERLDSEAGRRTA